MIENETAEPIRTLFGAVTYGIQIQGAAALFFQKRCSGVSGHLGNSDRITRRTRIDIFFAVSNISISLHYDITNYGYNGTARFSVAHIYHIKAFLLFTNSDKKVNMEFSTGKAYLATSGNSASNLYMRKFKIACITVSIITKPRLPIAYL